MKKLFCVLVCFLLIVPVFAAPDAPEITFQPQNYTFPEDYTACYTVRASGSNLTAVWFMEYEGTTYQLPETDTVYDPWTAHVSGSYGAFKDGNNYNYYFNGVKSGLTGAEIWCVMEDGHYDVTSDRAIISIGGNAAPPNIEDVPARLTVTQGQDAELRCIASSADESQLSFLWYETSTGKLQDIIAMNRGTEDSDYLFLDTSTPGTRYYVCMVTTSAGGSAYTGVIPVTVEGQQPPIPEITTTSIPSGTVGTPYSTKLTSTYPKAQWTIYYNPAARNELDATGLVLKLDGTISGTPNLAGTFAFCVCAAGPGGEDYREYTITIAEPEATGETTVETTQVTEATTAPTEMTTETTTEPTQVTAPSTEAPIETEGTQGAPKKESAADLTWLWVLLTGLAAGGIGVGATLLILKKKK